MNDRHPKWKRVEAGMVIPAGQPYRVERGNVWERATEYVGQEVRVQDNGLAYFVDSSWVPPLVLPTEPTWGIVIRSIGGPALVDRWAVRQSGKHLDSLWAVVDADNVVDFIECTPDQIARLEARR